jgi:integrase
VGEAKNRKVREVPIPDWLMLHLGDMRPKGTTRGLILVAGTNEEGEQISHHKNFTAKPVARIGRKLRILGLTPHRLRATFATAHFEAGTPLSQIQQMLGHEDPQTTMGYIVQRPKDQIKAQSRVAKSMGFRSTSPSQVPGKPKTNKKKPNKSTR